MARPTKSGLDYFPFDVDFFEDEKIEAISGEFGIKGELTAIKLLCAIYKNGYFVVWCDLLKMKLLKRLPGVNAELLDQIVRRLVRWGFFDKTLFDSANILTSPGIQKRFVEATARRHVRDNRPHWLLDSDPKANEIAQDFVIDDINGVNAYINPRSTGINACINPQSKVKESKVNKAAAANAADAHVRVCASRLGVFSSAAKKPEIPKDSTMPCDAQESQLPITEELPNGIICADFIALLDEFGAKFNLIDGRCYYRQMESLVRDMHRPGLVDGITVVRDGLKKLDTAKAILAGKPKMTPTRFLRSDIFLKLINGDYDELYTTKQTGKPSGRSGTVIEGTDYSDWGK